MKDKVSELRNILNQKKSMEAKKQSLKKSKSAKADQESEDKSQSPPNESQDKQEHHQELPEGDLEAEYEELKIHYDEVSEANKIQKEMYLRKVAEFENFKKRLQKEQEELIKYSNEKILEDLFPVLDSLEMTLSHVQDKNDPVASGVQLILKQLIQTIEKHGVKQISGEGEDYDPHLQEAISTEESEDYESGKVTKVHRKGYTLNGKLIRAAMVTVSK